MFIGIISWLMGLAKRSKFTVDRYDDPGTATSKLLAELKAMGAGADVLDFPPLKLRTGSGEPAVRILLFCADAALLAQGFKWARPAYPEEP
jgi:estrogen-related receptor beta like 1